MSNVNLIAPKVGNNRNLIFIKPILGYDPLQNPANLVFDLGSSSSLIQLFNKEIGTNSWSLELSSMVMMPSVENKTCLQNVNSYNIKVDD